MDNTKPESKVSRALNTDGKVVIPFRSSICLLKGICGSIQRWNTHKCLLNMYLHLHNVGQELCSTSRGALRCCSNLAHHRLPAIPLGQRRSIPRSLFKETKNFAEGESFLGGDAPVRPDPLDRRAGRPAPAILRESTHKHHRRACYMTSLLYNIGVS